MPSRVSEAIILRTYPLREADLIVSFLSRDLGKLRGVARRARKPGNRFGSGIERLSHVKMFYFTRENQELATLDGCEIIGSRFGLASEYETTVGLDVLAEVSEHLLPPNEPNEKYFRLLLAVTAFLLESGSPGLWPAVTYFSLWAVRLGGFLAPLELTEVDQEIAEEMLRTPISNLTPRPWSRTTAIALRRQLLHLMEEHCERRFVTAPYLESL